MHFFFFYLLYFRPGPPCNCSLITTYRAGGSRVIVVYTESAEFVFVLRCINCIISHRTPATLLLRTGHLRSQGFDSALVVPPGRRMHMDANRCFSCHRVGVNYQQHDIKSSRTYCAPDKELVNIKSCFQNHASHHMRQAVLSPHCNRAPLAMKG